MAATDQSFVVFAGDSAFPVFTVTQGPNGAPIDISGAAEITFALFRTYADAAAILTKTKTGGGIAFVGGGTTGQFKVNLLGVDTAALSGSYVFAARVLDGAGNTTTVAIGSVQVGAAVTWTYDATQLTGTTAYSLLMQVRTLIGDTNPKDQQLWDGQIAFALSQENNNIYLAGADCCLQLAAKFSRDVDTFEGTLHRMYSARQKAYATRAVELKAKASSRSFGVAYGGGISVSDKQLQNANVDRVQPAFMRGLTDNWLPTAPIDNQIGRISGEPSW